MNCIIPGQNLKVFARALHALTKIGDDLYIEAFKEQLRLVVLNLRKTVCVQYNLLDVFFSNYEVEENDLGTKPNCISCKIHMKTLLPLFKGTHLEKKLDYIKIEYENNSDFIQFKMKYKFDEILMTHKLRLMEAETLSIDISPDEGHNNITTSSTFCNQLLNMFSNSDDEILFEISKDKVVVRNYYVGAPIRPKSVRSHVNLNGCEFTSFRIEKETTVNFSLKPFRTAIQFADSFNLNILLNFEIGGKPLSIVMKNPTFEVAFIVATLNPYNANQSTGSTSIPARITNANRNISADDQEVLLNENWDDLSIENNRLPVRKSVVKNRLKELTFHEIVEKATNGINKLNNVEKDNNRTEVREFVTDILDVQKSPQSLNEKSPESPKTKRAKLVFGRCFESTFSKNCFGEVLAPNSDSE